MNSSAMWAEIGAQLRRPQGLAGRLAGHAMRLANARANAMAVKALALQSGEHIIELGCGPGQALRRILSHDVGAVTGIDHSEVMVDQARRRNAGAVAAMRLTLLCGDFTRLPIGDASADAVLAVNVAYFMSDGAAIREAHRVLKPGGRLVVYATAARSMRNWRFVGAHSHRLFDERGLQTLLTEAGFQRALTIRQIDAGLGVEGYIATARR